MERYDASIAKLNSAWKLNLTAWSQLPLALPFPKTASRNVDNLAFAEYYSSTYHQIAASAIRAHDPNHLVLGSRYNDIGSPVVQAVIKGASKSTDLLDVHMYSMEPDVDTLWLLHNITTGKPLLVSEFGFTARDSGLPNTKGAAPVLMTQTQRAAAFQHYIKTLVGLPFTVGYHQFMWMVRVTTLVGFIA
jgi:agarase